MKSLYKRENELTSERISLSTLERGSERERAKRIEDLRSHRGGEYGIAHSIYYIPTYHTCAHRTHSFKIKQNKQKKNFFENPAEQPTTDEIEQTWKPRPTSEEYYFQYIGLHAERTYRALNKLKLNCEIFIMCPIIISSFARNQCTHYSYKVLIHIYSASVCTVFLCAAQVYSS